MSILSKILNPPLTRCMSLLYLFIFFLFGLLRAYCWPVCHTFYSFILLILLSWELPKSMHLGPLCFPSIPRASERAR